MSSSLSWDQWDGNSPESCVFFSVPNLTLYIPLKFVLDFQNSTVLNSIPKFLSLFSLNDSHDSVADILNRGPHRSLGDNNGSPLLLLGKFVCNPNEVSSRGGNEDQ